LFGNFVHVFVDKRFEPLKGGDVFLDGGDLVAGYVFGDVAAVLAVLEVVIRLAVRTCANDGEMTALHAGNGGQLSDAS